MSSNIPQGESIAGHEGEIWNHVLSTGLPSAPDFPGHVLFSCPQGLVWRDFWQVLCVSGWVFGNPIISRSRTLGKSRTEAQFPVVMWAWPVIKDKDDAVMGADSATQVDPAQSSKTLEREAWGIGVVEWGWRVEFGSWKKRKCGKAPETTVGGEHLERR